MPFPLLHTFTITQGVVCFYPGAAMGMDVIGEWGSNLRERIGEQRADLGFRDSQSVVRARMVLQRASVRVTSYVGLAGSIYVCSEEKRMGRVQSRS